MNVNSDMLSDIISGHKERMINLKKYYPFFKLSEVSFSQLEAGKYEALDMGYILMAVIRFFIEQNNFREKDVLYSEYENFVIQIIKNDFQLELTISDYENVAQYIFDKLTNEGKPFDFEYFDPVDRKKKVSRVRIIDSYIKDNIVKYSITSEAVEFYLDTKEIKDESRISVAQLLLEKMIRSQNFRGGVEVVARINEEVNRLKLKKDEVVSILSSDVFAGLKAYEDFVNTGMKWFEEEERLFKKNRILIENALKKLSANSNDDSSYYKTINDIYELENQLKIAMNRHFELLKACTDMQKLTDDAVRRAKLGRLRSHIDFSTALKDMIKTDNAKTLEWFIKPLLKPKVKKFFDIISIDEALTQRISQSEVIEKVSNESAKEIVFADELEDSRIKDNYTFLMNNLLQAFSIRSEFTLEEFNIAMQKTYGDKVLLNADYYSFFVNLCQKQRYEISDKTEESLLYNIFKDNKNVHINGNFVFEIIMNNTSKVKIGKHCEISNVCFRKENINGR
mgnify:FL=1